MSAPLSPSAEDMGRLRDRAVNALRTAIVDLKHTSDKLYGPEWTEDHLAELRQIGWRESDIDRLQALRKHTVARQDEVLLTAVLAIGDYTLARRAWADVHHADIPPWLDSRGVD